jgi:hypothetical protein
MVLNLEVYDKILKDYENCYTPGQVRSCQLEVIKDSENEVLEFLKGNNKIDKNF